MDTGTLLTIILIIILFEYIFRLKNEIEKRAEEKFEKWKNEYLADEAKKREATSSDPGKPQ